VLQSRVVAADEIGRIAERARAAVERSERTGEPGLYVTLDELIDGTSGPS
jgi:hypothetical protein